MIIDNYSILGQDGYIVDWFIEIVNSIKEIKRLFICLISRRRIRPQQLLRNEYIFAIEMPELERYERNALFNALFELEDCQINKEAFGTICELFNGFPEQVFFAFDILISEGLPYLMDNLYLIPDHNSEKVAHIIQKYESDEFKKQILGFLSDCEFISLDFLEKVFAVDFQRIISVIEDFANNFIIEFVGATKEYFRLNDAIRDHIQRLGIRVDEKYKRNLHKHVKSTFNDYDTLDRDMSDYVITVKEALKKGYDIPTRLLLPSHFLNAMRDLYNNERRYSDVINLADRVLLQEKYLDKRISREVRYWLCLSLSRKRDKRMLKEVQKIEGPDHNFLLGFFYRLTGRFEDAIARLTAVLESNPGHNRAKRELVQVYLSVEEYDTALELAKENYELSKNNPYHLQSYFRCLVMSLTRNNSNSPSPVPQDKKEELSKLIESLKDNPHRKSREMCMIAEAQFIAIIENNENRALGAVDDAIATYSRSIYPQLTRIEICRKFKNWQELECSVNSIDTVFQFDSEIFSKLGYLSARAIIMARKGDLRESQKFIQDQVKPRFTKGVYKRLKEEIDSIQLKA